MTADAKADATWAALAELDEPAQLAAMRERFVEVTSLSGADVDRTVDGMVAAEYSLDDEALHRFTASRLRTWVQLAVEDPDRAQRIARYYDGAFERAPGGLAMRGAALVQTVARGLTGEEIDALRDLIPSLVQQLPRARQDILTTDPDATAGAAERETRKPWWKFW